MAKIGKEWGNMSIKKIFLVGATPHMVEVAAAVHHLSLFLIFISSCPNKGRTWTSF